MEVRLLRRVLPDGTRIVCRNCFQTKPFLATVVPTGKDIVLFRIGNGIEDFPDAVCEDDIIRIVTDAYDALGDDDQAVVDGIPVTRVIPAWRIKTTAENVTSADA